MPVSLSATRRVNVAFPAEGRPDAWPPAVRRSDRVGLAMLLLTASFGALVTFGGQAVTSDFLVAVFYAIGIVVFLRDLAIARRVASPPTELGRGTVVLPSIVEHHPC